MIQLNSKKTVAIIQARMSSRRLPGKVLTEIKGKPMLHHVVLRAQQAKMIDLTVVATSEHSDDDRIAAFCADRAISCFRGNLEDVLDRFYRAASHFAAQNVVRLTADCPLLDPEVIDKVVRKYAAENFDYVSNTLECTYPDGLDTEVFSLAALERTWREARKKSEREHVTPYIRNHAELFRLANVSHEENLSQMRWTVDEPRDLDFVRSLFDKMGSDYFGLQKVLNITKQYRELNIINAGIGRNEGYLKSLREDRQVLY